MNQQIVLGVAVMTLLAGCSSSPSSNATRTGGKSGVGGTSGSGGTSSGTGGNTPTGSGGSASVTGGAIGSGTGGGAVGTGGTSASTGGGAAGSIGTGGGGGRVGASSGGTASGGSSSSGGAGGTVANSNSVLERNKNPSRDGHFIQPLLTRAKLTTMARDTAFNATFSGAMYASPLYLENGPGGKGVFFAVTTGNDVYAIDETTGAVVWRRNLGSSPTANGVSCGNIHPLGIVGTPVIDPVSRSLYVGGAIGTTSIARHEIHALSVDDGTEKAGWPIDVSRLTAATASGGTLAFNSPAQNQRSALSLVNGILYVPYGGHNGDCGVYHGWIVAVNTANPAMVSTWASIDQGEAIWAAGGMASDGTSLFASTGDRRFGPNAGSSVHADSEEVLRVTGMASVTRNNANVFYPSSWRAMDSTDADFAAINPILVTVPGATPANLVVAIAKDGHMYLLDKSNLGGIGGQLVDYRVASASDSMAIRTVPTSYRSTRDVYVSFSSTGAICPAGMASGTVVMGVALTAAAPPVARTTWCTALSGELTSPVATTTDGSADATVWHMNNGRLRALDGDTGAVLYTSADTCTLIRKWTSPIAVKGRIIVGGDGHLCSWSPH